MEPRIDKKRRLSTRSESPSNKKNRENDDIIFLTVYDKTVTDDSIIPTKHRSVQHVSIVNCPMDQQTKSKFFEKMVINMPFLKCLDLTDDKDNEIPPACFQMLLKIPTLKRLVLNNVCVDITSNEFVQFIKNTQIETLAFQHNSAPVDKLVWLAELVCANTSIRTFNFKQDGIAYTALYDMLGVFATSGTIECLSISRCELVTQTGGYTDIDTRGLDAFMLSTRNNIHHLELTAPDNKTARHIVNLLAQNHTLTRFYLHVCDHSDELVTDADIPVLVDMFNRNKTITNFNVETSPKVRIIKQQWLQKNQLLKQEMITQHTLLLLATKHTSREMPGHIAGDMKRFFKTILPDSVSM